MSVAFEDAHISEGPCTGTGSTKKLDGHVDAHERRSGARHALEKEAGAATQLKSEAAGS
jgi:hypothetical protein